jgi:hypothetical protein
MAMLSVILLILWVYADAAGLIDPATSAGDRRRGYWVSGYSIAVFGLSIVVAAFDSDIPKLVWLLLLLSRLFSRPFVRDGAEG